MLPDSFLILSQGSFIAQTALCSRASTGVHGVSYSWPESVWEIARKLLPFGHLK